MDILMRIGWVMCVLVSAWAGAGAAVGAYKKKQAAKRQVKQAETGQKGEEGMKGKGLAERDRNVEESGFLEGCGCTGSGTFVEDCGCAGDGMLMEDDDFMKLVTVVMPDGSVKFTKAVLDCFRKNVGRYRAETGGMLASSRNEDLIDCCYFDSHAKRTSGTFYYDVESMSKVFRKWKAKGYITNGIFHSHPIGVTRPSYHDISSALIHMEFFGLDYFYLPVFQNDRRGFYTMYFYVVRKAGEDLEVNLDYIVKAVAGGYEYPAFRPWKMNYSIEELEEYRETVKNDSEKSRNGTAEGDRAAKDCSKAEKEGVGIDRQDELFNKVKNLYPQHVLDKVIVSVGTGGARSALENFARNGFGNFILIDGDVVSPSNVATQGVYISEIGRKKTEVLKERILDINPKAKVVCVDRFLNDQMTDQEFKGYLDLFEGKKPTDYLIMGCTDQFQAQKRSSILALKYGIPYLAAMMYKGGAAAELIFTYPGVTESCPRCLLRRRFEMYENGFVNDVGSDGCTVFATERMNALKGYIALMLLNYHENPSSPYHTMLDKVKDRNFVWIRLDPQVSESMGISLFDKAFAGAEKYTFMDETIWVPQKPDHPENGSEPCRLCGGTGRLDELYMKWGDTRVV